MGNRKTRPERIPHYDWDALRERFQIPKGPEERLSEDARIRADTVLEKIRVHCSTLATLLKAKAKDKDDACQKRELLKVVTTVLESEARNLRKEVFGPGGQLGIWDRG
jgi:hypothetical protein